jgi:PadR family transcriptional regulator PadR
MRQNPGINAALSPQTFYILLALYERPLHGYAIMDQVAQDSSGEVIVHSATLYRALARLTRDGFIAETTGQAPATPGKDRRYYAITDQGKAAFKLEVDRLKRASILGHQQLYGPQAWRML